jgi:Trk K+ transport system NAD-binding subunit
VTRVMVAGSGVWGSYIADHLVQAGHEVLVVEQDAATARRARAAGGRTVVAGPDGQPSSTSPAGATVVAVVRDDQVRAGADAGPWSRPTRSWP